MYKRVVSGYFHVQLHSMSKLKHHVYPVLEDFEHRHLANVCLRDDYEIYILYTIIIHKKHTMTWKMVIMDTYKNSNILILDPT